MIAFGRACRDTRNWRAGITLLVADAHFRHSRMLAGAEQLSYMKKPEVWADNRPVFEEYLKHRPDDAVARSKFAAMCFLAGHFPETQAQFEAVGDKLTAWREAPSIPLEELKRMRNETARYVTGKYREDDPATVLSGWLRQGGRNNEGLWTIALPVKGEQKQEAGILGAKARNVWSVTDGGITYTVRVQPVPPAARAGKPRAILDAARDAIAKERGGKIRDERPAKLAEYSAREYRVDPAATPSKVIRVRSALIGTRLYEVSVAGTEAEVSGKAVAAFLDSFQFQE